MRFLDLFAGIGGFRRGMELAGHTCVGFCEADPFAIASYTSMHLITDIQRRYLSNLPLKKRQKEILKEEYRNGEWFSDDIRRVSAADLPRAECWCFGSPCQSFSLAGKRAGLEGESGLVREIFRLLHELREEDRPRWIIYENVKGMLSSNGGWDYAAILAAMDDAGYDAEWQNINSSWFVPQNRERIYTIGHYRAFRTGEILPIQAATGKNCISQVGQLYGTEVEKNPSGGKVYSMAGIAAATGTGHGMSQPMVAQPFFFDMNYDSGAKKTELSRPILARYYKGVSRHPGENSGIAVPIADKENGKIRIIGKINSSQDGKIHELNGISKCISAGHFNSPKIALPLKVLGGVCTNASSAFNPGILRGMSRTVKSDRYNGIALGIIDDQGKIGKEVGIRKNSPTIKAQCHGNLPKVCMDVTGKTTKQGEGIYVQLPEGFVVYAVWNEEYSCYNAVRRMTPRECFRLQGWTDPFFDRAEFVNSDNQLYMQAGNGVTVPVVEAVGRKIAAVEKKFQEKGRTFSG